MSADSVDNLLIQWGEQRPGLNMESLGVAVRVNRLGALWDRTAEDALAQLGLTLWEYDVLSALRRQGPPFQLPATRLARATLISTGAITNRVDRLVDKGLVTRERDSHDRRAVIVRLSRDGLSLVHRAVEARVAVADASLESLSNKDREVLARLLRILLSGVEHDIAELDTPTS
ncbi:MAG: MarR family transcriptional regulator [Gammaproteobacteria bacterium]|nr:MarR family transcriptional regulator [Gammaproteobacteria bacterium]